MIRSEFDIQFFLLQTLPIVAMQRLHPTLDPVVRAPEELLIERMNGAAMMTIATAAYGHFGREGEGLTWEHTDKATALAEQAGVTSVAAS